MIPRSYQTLSMIRVATTPLDEPRQQSMFAREIRGRVVEALSIYSVLLARTKFLDRVSTIESIRYNYTYLGRYYNPKKIRYKTTVIIQDGLVE